MSKSSALHSLEKGGLLPAPAPIREAPRRGFSKGFCFLLAAVCAGIGLYALGPQCLSRQLDASYGEVTLKEDLCPQESPLAPSKNGELWEELSETYGTKEFLHQAVELLGGAVKVPYVSLPDPHYTNAHSYAGRKALTRWLQSARTRVGRCSHRSTTTCWLRSRTCTRR